jgi:hypothetical protein
MSRTTKIILAIVGSLLVLGICACAAGIVIVNMVGNSLENAVVTDPGQVASISSGIAGYSLPSGFTEVGMNFLGLSQGIVASGGRDGKQVIILMQLPMVTGTDAAELEQSLQDRFLQDQAGEMQWILRNVITAQIRGQEVELKMRDGSDSYGSTYRTLTGVFQGEGGPVILMCMGPRESWDQKAIDAFLGSIY